MAAINVFTENLFNSWQPDEKDIIDKTRRMLEFYVQTLGEKSCLKDKVYSSITLDIVLCDSSKTREYNRDYRGKDYPADIITFAIFADSEEKFIFDGEINLGEVMIALDKVRDEALKKGKAPEDELAFLISHGILHLLGFDHQTEADYDFIVALQNEALQSIGIKYD